MGLDNSADLTKPALRKTTTNPPWKDGKNVYASKSAHIRESLSASAS